MAAGATDLLEQPLAFGQQRRVLGELLHIQMARGAARLNFAAAQQRKFPQMDFAMGLLDAIHRHSLAFMAAGAAELVRRMGAVGEQHFTARMGLEWMGFFLEARTVDR